LAYLRSGPKPPARAGGALPFERPIVSFGVTADYDSVPDLDVLIQGIRHGLDELSAQQAGELQQG